MACDVRLGGAHLGQNREAGVVEKLNPVATVNSNTKAWLGHGAVLALYGFMVAGALLVRSRTRRSSAPGILDLAVIAAGIAGVVAVGNRLIRSRGQAVDEPKEAEDERFYHPAINVQRISFA